MPAMLALQPSEMPGQPVARFDGRGASHVCPIATEVRGLAVPAAIDGQNASDAGAVQGFKSAARHNQALRSDWTIQ